MPSSPNTLGTTTGYYELGPASRHRNAIQVDSPLAADVQQDQNRRLAGLLHYGPQFPSKLVLIGDDSPGCVAWRQDSDSGSSGYGLCHVLLHRRFGCVASWPHFRTLLLTGAWRPRREDLNVLRFLTCFDGLTHHVKKVCGLFFLGGGIGNDRKSEAGRGSKV